MAVLSPRVYPPTVGMLGALSSFNISTAGCRSSHISRARRDINSCQSRYLTMNVLPVVTRPDSGRSIRVLHVDFAFGVTDLDGTPHTRQAGQAVYRADDTPGEPSALLRRRITTGRERTAVMVDLVRRGAVHLKRHRRREADHRTAVQNGKRMPVEREGNHHHSSTLAASSARSADHKQGVLRCDVNIWQFRKSDV